MESSAPQRYCDIVMKGGITSGVVYPLAAVELAEKHGYEFRNVGGTSAGAIAAAAVAAAEHGKRTDPAAAPYSRLAALPAELGRNLTSLFQPTPRMRPLFNTLLACIGRGWPARLAAPLNAFPLAALLGCLPGGALIAAAAVLHGSGALRIATGLVGLCVLLAGPYVSIAIAAAWRARALPRQGFGLCPGSDQRGSGTPALTTWLATLIDELAGKSPDADAPLTFGDLWSLPAPPGERGLNLQMVTTNLSQGRPYSLPFEAGEEFWFDPEEFRNLFPPRIVDYMLTASPSCFEGPEGRCLHRFPESEKLPVVVAARMSLSFPGLISAIPLYALNDAPKTPSPVPERCWFSDGGITSNFPVHFFDSPVPRWPTFAIDLMGLAPDRELDESNQCENVWLPETNKEGIAEAWVGWEGKSAGRQTLAFAGSIFRTAQNWIDNRQARGAGFRDRIAHVRLSKIEGGMNLNMESKKIEDLAERGRCAAAELARRFGPEPPEGTELDWANQKWVRYRSYMELLERRGREARLGFLDESLGASLAELREDPPSYPPPEGEGCFDVLAIDEAVAQFAAWDDEDDRFSGNAPSPRTEPWSIPRV